MDEIPNLPQYVIIDLSSHLKELKSYILTDDRGYEEMVRQAFDYLFYVWTADVNITSLQIPNLVMTMIRGLPRINTIAGEEEIQLCFTTLYDGIVRELISLKFDKTVEVIGSFPYVLDRIRADRQVVLRFVA